MFEKVVVKNKKAYFNYNIEDVIEAGIVLIGSEVKSLRSGNANIDEAYVSVHNKDVIINNAHIANYPNAHNLPDPRRPRKLLLKKREIDWLRGKVTQKGFTLLPLKIYFKDGKYAKVEIALAKGKKKYDKREIIKKREAEREVKKYKH